MLSHKKVFGTINHHGRFVGGGGRSQCMQEHERNEFKGLNFLKKMENGRLLLQEQ